VNDAYIGMVERGGRFGFSPEALFFGLAGDQFVRKELQGDGSLELQIEGAVNHPHAARTCQAQDLIVADTISRG